MTYTVYKALRSRGCLTDVHVSIPVYWEKSEGTEGEGQCDLYSDCGDERSLHFLLP